MLADTSRTALGDSVAVHLSWVVFILWSRATVTRDSPKTVLVSLPGRKFISPFRFQLLLKWIWFDGLTCQEILNEKFLIRLFPISCLPSGS